MSNDVRLLRELAKTALEGYTGLAAYECSEDDTRAATFLAKVATETADRLEAEAKDANPCPFNFSHTKHWCGYDGCRDE